MKLALAILVPVVFAFGLWVFYKKMNAGFGPFNTAIFILVFVLFLAAIGVLTGKLEGASLYGLLIGIAGFAGGLFAAKAS